MRVKQEVQELFPTPLWIVDLAAADAVGFNARLKAEIETIISPRPTVPSGSNWQTPHDLHTRPAFADFTRLVELTAQSVAQYLELERFPMMITGCWANINPPGAYHPTHNHPNNYLSGVYYVAVPDGGPALVFQDPRPIAMMPWTGKLSRITANASVARPQPGRMVIFPALAQAPRSLQPGHDRAHQHLVQSHVHQLRRDAGRATMEADGRQRLESFWPIRNDLTLRRPRSGRLDRAG